MNRLLLVCSILVFSPEVLANDVIVEKNVLVE